LISYWQRRPLLIPIVKALQKNLKTGEKKSDITVGCNFLDEKINMEQKFIFKNLCQGYV